MVIFVLFLLSVGLIIAPLFLEQLSAQSRIVLMSIGGIFTLIFGIAAVIAKLYKKASANMARTAGRSSSPSSTR
jgi:hypothetical protein